MHDELFGLMMKFQLCYVLPGNGDAYIVPQLLAEDRPYYEWEKEGNLQLRYEYPDFMPRRDYNALYRGYPCINRRPGACLEERCVT